jgi:NhaP-type Na+/H+ and K+/H+ antiporter
MEHTEHRHTEQTIGYFTATVSVDSFVVGKQVRDVMWPNSLVILNIKTENIDSLDNDGERRLYANDKISFKCRYYDKKELFENIQHLVGKDHEIEE